MFAVIKTGGKQYRVAAQDVIIVERLTGSDGTPAEAGDSIAFDDVLMIGEGERITLGSPKILGAAVLGEVVEQKRGRKIRVFKKRRRSTYRRRAGHRQYQTVIKILEIAENGLKSAPAKAKKAAPQAAEAEAAHKADKKAPKAAASMAAKSTDDLKLISGVGPKIEVKLHEMGIHSFDQIIAMDDAALQSMDDAIGFKGRSLREDWRGQAAELKAGGTPRAKVDQEAAKAAEIEMKSAKKPAAKKAVSADGAASDADTTPKKPRATKKKPEGDEQA